MMVCFLACSSCEWIKTMFFFFQACECLPHYYILPASASVFFFHTLLPFPLLPSPSPSMLTSIASGAVWSCLDSYQVRAAVDCCSPLPRWSLRSPHPCRAPLLSASPTARRRRTCGEMWHSYWVTRWKAEQLWGNLSPLCLVQPFSAVISIKRYLAFMKTFSCY